MTLYTKHEGLQTRMFDPEDLECTGCGQMTRLGDTVIVYNTYVRNQNIVFCEKCAHRIMSALIQDYAKMIELNNVFEHQPPAGFRTHAVIEASKSIGASLEEWLQYYQKFKSLES